MKNHINKDPILIHDGDNSHIELIEMLKVKDEFFKTNLQKNLTDEDNPLTPINQINSYIKKFIRIHEGFSRDDIQDWMNLISFILNKPENRYEKLKIFIEMAISSRKRVKFRDVMSKKDAKYAKLHQHCAN